MSLGSIQKTIVGRPLPQWVWWALPPELRIYEQHKTIAPGPLVDVLASSAESLGAERPAQSNSGGGTDLSVLITLAVETWRLERRVEKLKTNPAVEHRVTRPLESSVNKLKSMLSDKNVEFHDFDGRLFNDGMVEVKVLAMDRNASIPEAEERITETVTPSVSISGKLVARGEVIVTIGTHNQETENDTDNV